MKKSGQRTAPKKASVSAADRKETQAKLALANGRIPELLAAIKYTGIAGRETPLIVKSGSLSKTHSDLLARRDAPPAAKIAAWGFYLADGKYLWIDENGKKQPKPKVKRARPAPPDPRKAPQGPKNDEPKAPTPPPMSKEVLHGPQLTLEAAASLAGVSATCILWWIQQGLLEGTRHALNSAKLKWMVNPQALARLLAKRPVRKKKEHASKR